MDVICGRQVECADVICGRQVDCVDVTFGRQVDFADVNEVSLLYFSETIYILCLKEK